jgi:hypothetical protein
MSQNKKLREILYRHIAKHIIDDSEGAIEADLLAWHRAALTQEREHVCDFLKEHIGLADDHPVLVAIRALPPIEEGEAT